MNASYPLGHFSTIGHIIIVTNFVQNVESQFICDSLAVIRGEHTENYLWNNALPQNSPVDRSSSPCTIEQPSTELDTLLHHSTADPTTLVPWIGAKIEHLHRSVRIVPLKNIHIVNLAKREQSRSLVSLKIQCNTVFNRGLEMCTETSSSSLFN